ncbi:MAG: T9SS type A sorting domain-containing protein [Bacteroidota bacterium]
MRHIIFILILPLISLTANAQWERKTGVEPGEVKGFAKVDTLLFAATGGGIYKSSNGGGSWQLSSNGLSQLNINCIHFDGTRLWAGTELGGVFMSPDTGATWILRQFNGVKTSSITSNAGGVFVTRDGGYMHRTTDLGQSWTFLDGNNGIPTSNCIKAVSYGDTLVLLTTFGISRSLDAGQSWTLSNNGFVPPLYRRTLDVFGNQLFCTSFNKIYKSTDGGQNWTMLPGNGIDSTSSANSFIILSSGNYLFATNLGIYRSTDMGSNWQLLTTEFGNYLCELQGRVFYAGNYNGFLTIAGSSDQGTTWNAYGNGIHSMSIGNIYANNNFLYTARHGGMQVSYNHADSFTTSNVLSEKPRFYSFGGAVYATTSSGISVSTDAGLSFSSINGDLSDLNITTLCITATTWFAGSSINGIWRSTNNGLNWTSTQGLPLGMPVNSIHPFEGKIYAATNSGLMVSNDDGLTWQSTSITTNVAEVTSVSNALLVAGSGSIRRSTDGGINWSNIPVGTNTNALYDLHVIGNTILAGTRFGGVRISHDGGLTWAGANEGLQDTLMIIQCFANDNQYMYFGTRGAGIWRRLLSDLNIIAPNAVFTDANGGHSINIFPNPAKVEIRLNCGETPCKNGFCSLFDLSGRMVKTQLLDAGQSMNIAELSKGMYQLIYTNALGEKQSSKLVIE